jgi:UDP-N-acetylglucosamine 4-epimerase
MIMPGEVFNITYGGRVYLNDLYWKICKLLEVDIQPIYGPERPGDIKHSNADISKAENTLGYHPKYDVDRGLEKVIDWYKRNL